PSAVTCVTRRRPSRRTKKLAASSPCSNTFVPAPKDFRAAARWTSSKSISARWAKMGRLRIFALSTIAGLGSMPAHNYVARTWTATNTVPLQLRFRLSEPVRAPPAGAAPSRSRVSGRPRLRGPDFFRCHSTPQKSPQFLRLSEVPLILPLHIAQEFLHVGNNRGRRRTTYKAPLD